MVSFTQVVVLLTLFSSTLARLDFSWKFTSSIATSVNASIIRAATHIDAIQLVEAYALGVPFQGGGTVFYSTSTVLLGTLPPTPLTITNSSDFGSSISISSNYLAIGAPTSQTTQGTMTNTTGAVYVYTRPTLETLDQININQITPLVADRSDTLMFGSTVVLDTSNPNNLGIFISAPGFNGAGGAVYYYILQGSTWTFSQILTPPSASVTFGFGNSIAVSRDSLIIGASNSNTIFFYDRDSSSSNWNVLQAVEVTGNIEFGSQVGIDFDSGVAAVSAPNSTIAVGEPLANFVNAGEVFILQRNDNSWEMTQQINAGEDIADFMRFGASLQLSGYSLVVSSENNLVLAYVIEDTAFTLLQPVPPIGSVQHGVDLHLADPATLGSADFTTNGVSLTIFKLTPSSDQFDSYSDEVFGSSRQAATALGLIFGCCFVVCGAVVIVMAFYSKMVK